MNDVFDRLLEHTLREELGPAHVAADLAQRVAAALSAATTARAAAARRPRQLRLRLAIAAAAAATVVAVAWLVARPAALECSTPLLAAGAAGEAFTLRTRIADGAVAWSAGAAAVSLAAADGTVLTLAPRTACALAVDRRTAELLGGTLELRPRRAPWRATAAGAELLVPDGSSVRCVLTPDVPAPPDPNDPNMNPNDLRELLRAASAAAIFTVTVLDGTAELATAQGKETVSAGQSRTVDAAGDRAAAAHARELYQQVRKELPPPEDEASMIAWKELDERFHELATSVLQRSEAAAAIRPDVLRDLAGGKLAAEPRDRALQLALLDEEARAFQVATRVWPLVQEQADFEQQVALAERGFEPAKVKLRESLAESRGVLDARAAAALAFGGDTTVRATLQPFLAATVESAAQDFQAFDARCQAAIALAAIGDGKALAELRSAIATQVDAWLLAKDPQQLAIADWCVQRGTYYLGTSRPRLSWLDLRVQAASGRRTGEPDEASIRAALKAIAPK